MSEVKNTLKNRGSVYGDYAGNVELRYSIMNLIKERYMLIHDCDMPDHLEGYVWDQANKLTRLAATPNHLDTWHDIQGYAKLTEDALVEYEEGV